MELIDGVQKIMIQNNLSTYFHKFDFIDFALLFGSFAENKVNHLSDVDIAIFTDKYLSLIETGFMTAQLESICRRKVDLIVLNDLYKKKPAFAYEIISKGQIILCKNQEQFIGYKKNTFLYFMDTKHLRNMAKQNLKERLKSGMFGERNFVRQN
ncbi:MAG: hypothetical protein IEMM0008_0929 [bacterium]|nr:MAG: hypothetical protein IEMM0008_0929 [bacterium]